jgi:DNA-binding SARP family transcriptional activator
MQLPTHSPLAVRLLGSFEARLHDVPLRPFRTRKGEWLLAHLILRYPRPVERAVLAGLLWPDSSEPRALNSLRVALSDLRRALGPEGERLYSPSVQTLTVNLAGAWTDVREFDAAIAHRPAPVWEDAVALYRGPLLDGCDEPWVLPERESRRQHYLQSLEALAAESRNRRDPGQRSAGCGSVWPWTRYGRARSEP